MTYESFCLDFMEPNLPVILEVGGWTNLSMVSANKTRGMQLQHRSACTLLGAHCWFDMCTAHPRASVQGVAVDWRATRDWVLPDGGIDLDFLQRRFGAATVTVTDTARCEARASC